MAIECCWVNGHSLNGHISNCPPLRTAKVSRNSNKDHYLGWPGCEDSLVRWGSGVPVLVGGHLCGCSCVGCVLGEGCLPLPPFLSVGERGDVDVMQYFWTQMYSAAFHLALRICPIKKQGAGFVCSLFAVLTQTEKTPIFPLPATSIPIKRNCWLCHFPSKVVFLSTRLSVQCQCTPKRLRHLCGQDWVWSHLMGKLSWNSIESSFSVDSSEERYMWVIIHSWCG